MTADGLALTNYHVVSQFALDPKTYRLEYLAPDGARGPLQLLAIDVAHDLADGVEHPQRFVGEAVEDRRAGDGEFGDGPAGGDVAEVDDAVEIAGGGEHGVVVGEVAVDHLPAQVGTHRIQPGERVVGDPPHLVPARCRHVGKQQIDHLARVLQVPLGALGEAGVVEVAQGERDAGRECSECGGVDLRRGEGGAVDEAQQPHPSVDTEGSRSAQPK